MTESNFRVSQAFESHFIIIQAKFERISIKRTVKIMRKRINIYIYINLRPTYEFYMEVLYSRGKNVTSIRSDAIFLIETGILSHQLQQRVFISVLEPLIHSEFQLHFTVQMWNSNKPPGDLWPPRFTPLTTIKESDVGTCLTLTSRELLSVRRVCSSSHLTRTSHSKCFCPDRSGHRRSLLHQDCRVIQSPLGSSRRLQCVFN